ncbi:Yip1 family protein [Streptomyces sp. TRM 70361]|uniref:Yip1 family protein n=1 Tax=Streptomyces sp. TRM 70361 TaxID=3116553 RepID=UPI002E7BCF12|nr:Yip1 family protein [Streptomyces sp. TRM 70361]MEE1942367.1 Yip1 family protein [Streptomyces sp. TRM 70361]
MAGFRMGRGRDSRSAQQHGQHPPRQAPGPGPYGPPAAHGRPPYGPPQPTQPQWRQGGDRHGEPEYFGDPGHGRPGGHDPYADNPGHTQVFGVGDVHGPGGHQGDDYGAGATYGAGGQPAPVGPRLPWKQLLSGIVLRPNATFWQMRDHTMWGPAVGVTFLYGLLAVFGFEQAREDAINSTLSTAIPFVLITGVAVVISALLMGAVTHTLARQLGGNGLWAPTIGLSMLIMSITDAPRLLLAMFLGGDDSLVQIVGWITWLAAGALFTSMVSRSHELPWPKALGASSIQLVALLFLIKLGTF